MARPTRRDEAVIRRAAELMLPDFKRWLNDPRVGDDRLIDDLMDVLEFGTDGYDMAKSLEHKGYGPDSALVELLENSDLYTAERELVAEEGEVGE